MDSYGQLWTVAHSNEQPQTVTDSNEPFIGTTSKDVSLARDMKFGYVERRKLRAPKLQDLDSTLWNETPASGEP